MSKADEILKELEKKICEHVEFPKKIKMRQDFYDFLATLVQHDVEIIEILDENKQPLNTLFSLKIEIDDTINTNYEVVF